VVDVRRGYKYFDIEACIHRALSRVSDESRCLERGQEAADEGGLGCTIPGGLTVVYVGH